MDVKQVTFNEIVLCRATISRQDYTESEAQQTWLSCEEMKKMAQRQFQTVERMESGKESRRESTYRGLECMSRKGEAELEGIIKYCIDAVMDEQDRQFYLFENIQDHEMIALASLNCSEACTQKALKRARSDEREAKRCYRRMQDMSSEAIHGKDNQNSGDASFSSVSVIDEPQTIPILKTGNNTIKRKKGDNRESALQAQEVVC